MGGGGFLQNIHTYKIWGGGEVRPKKQPPAYAPAHDHLYPPPPTLSPGSDSNMMLPS